MKEPSLEKLASGCASLFAVPSLTEFKDVQHCGRAVRNARTLFSWAALTAGIAPDRIEAYTGCRPKPLEAAFRRRYCSDSTFRVACCTFIGACFPLVMRFLPTPVELAQPYPDCWNLARHRCKDFDEHPDGSTRFSEYSDTDEFASAVLRCSNIRQERLFNGMTISRDETLRRKLLVANSGRFWKNLGARTDVVYNALGKQQQEDGV